MNLNPWLLLTNLLERWRDEAEKAHARVDDDDEQPARILAQITGESVSPYRVEPTPLIARGPRMRVRGAWCGLASLANPERDVAFAKSIGLNRLDIIINDHSASRLPRAFDHRDTQKIVTLARMARDAGIEVHLMSWLMPHRLYISQAAARIPELVERTGAKSVMWDAEEPWTLAKNRMPYADAAAHLGDMFADFDFEMGVTGIRYVSTAKLKPLVDVCDYVTPQCYATSTSKADPSTVVTRGVELWRKKFGDRPRMVPGLAAYRQTGIKGHTVASAMTACLDDAYDHASEVVFWGLNSIRKSPQVAGVIRRLSELDAVPDPQRDVTTEPLA